MPVPATSTSRMRPILAEAVAPEDAPKRPELSPRLSGPEFARWYWTKDELAAFVRGCGLASSGGKEHLAARITAFLDGAPQPAPAPRRPSGRQLSEPLRAHTVIPVGQRCSQILRAWLTDRLGSGFHFDAPMREFFANADGTSTLADALDHWAATRGVELQPIDAQFELNRFTRDWHAKNPGGGHAEMLSAWKRHRSLPAEMRD